MRKRHLLLLVALLALPASASGQAPSGQATLTLSPATAGKHSRLGVVASGDAVASGQQPPKSLSLFITRGFKLDPRARKGRCTQQQASSYSCPVDSRVATGSAEGQATVPVFGNIQFSATIEAFLTPRVQPGDIAGVVVQAHESRSGRQASIQGRLVPVPTGAFGAELRFENFNLPQQQAPPGSSAKLTKFDLSVEARRRVRKVRVVKRRVHTRHGTKVKRHRKVRIRRYYLITNPRTCPGSWPYQLRATFPSGPDVVRDGSVACQS